MPNGASAPDDDHAGNADSEGVAIRVGLHCAKRLMRVLGVPATARAYLTA